MLPSTLPLFGATVSLYSLALGIGAFLTIAWAVGRQRTRRGAWVDVGLIASGCASIGARAMYVALHWDHFAVQLNEAIRIAAGGLSWQGAALGGTIGLVIGARLRRLAPDDVFAAFAPAPAVLVAAGWIGCAGAVCAWGKEVTTLADYPSWSVAWARDVYGLYGPRYATPVYGAALALVVWGGGRAVPAKARRFWTRLALAAVGMAALGFWRADPMPTLFGLRADQAADLVIAGWAGVLGFSPHPLRLHRGQVHPKQE